ncbi:MAG TPA: polysaccharide deacetylase family protein [Acidimicrobiales bacterium]|nr:polysaccharide deacetylase family protein [Acidimicrobiales bacterium]
MRLAPFVAPAVVAGGVWAVHAAPVVTSIEVLRRRALPALAGVGRSDHVGLTFDDGPDPASTPLVLDALDRLGWKATFFMLGSMTRAHPSVAREVVAAGHEIAVHGDEHRSELFRTPGAIADDLSRALDTVAGATGVAPRWFRPPYGVLATAGLRAAKRLGLHTVLWTAWGRDWRPQATPDSVVEDVLAGLRPGGTILLHDSDCTSAPESWRSTLGALPALAEALGARGLAVGTLAEHGIALAV